MALVYTAIGDVTARVPGRTIGASSKPTTTEVTQWLTEGEAILLGHLSAGGITAPAAATTGGAMLKSWATDFAEAHVRMAWASTAGDENKDGSSTLERFYELLQDILDRPAMYQAMLNGGGGSASSTDAAGANTDPNSDDFIDAEFERDEVY